MPTNIRRAGDKITFSYYTNTQKNTLCKLMNKSGATRSNMMIMPAGRQDYSFLHIDPKREYLLQCLIGDDLSSAGGTFLDSSQVFTIPRDKSNYLWSMIRLMIVLLFLGSGIFALILLFKRPELFDVFFAPYRSILLLTSSRDDPEKQSLLHRKPTSGRGSSKLMGGRNWVCDVCHSINSSNSSYCGVCHQPRSITPINVSSSVVEAAEGDKPGEVAVDMPRSDRHRRSHHSRRNAHRHTRSETSMSKLQTEVVQEGGAQEPVAPMSLKPLKPSSRHPVKKAMNLSANSLKGVK